MKNENLELKTAIGAVLDYLADEFAEWEEDLNPGRHIGTHLMTLLDWYEAQDLNNRGICGKK